MNTAMKQRLITVANAIAVFAALLILWQLVLWIFHVPPFMLPPAGRRGRALVARFPSLLASFAITAEESAGGPRGKHRLRRSDRAPLRAVPLGPANALPLHIAAANSPNRSHRSPDPDVGRRRHSGRHADCLHHFARAGHRQHHAGPDQRGRKSRPPLPGAQRDRPRRYFSATPPARRTVSFRRHPPSPAASP